MSLGCAACPLLVALYIRIFYILIVGKVPKIPVFPQLLLGNGTSSIPSWIVINEGIIWIIAVKAEGQQQFCLSCYIQSYTTTQLTLISFPRPPLHQIIFQTPLTLPELRKKMKSGFVSFTLGKNFTWSPLVVCWLQFSLKAQSKSNFKSGMLL